MKITKLIKANLIALAAVSILVGASAFKSKLVTQNYVYQGPDFSTAEFTNANNWKTSGSPTAEDCNGLTQLVTCSMDIPTGYSTSGHLDGSKVSITAAGSSGSHSIANVQDITDQQNPENLEFSQVKGDLP